DWMRAEVERWAAEHPGCRAHLLEWSVWSELGMGERMGVLDNLRGRGVAPIDPDDGARALLELLTDAEAPVTMLITGRYPAVPTLNLVPGPGHSTELRFADEARRVLRCAALRVAGGVEAVLRDDSDDFATDRFRVGAIGPAGEPAAAVEVAEPAESDQPHEFYRDVLFHRGRFQRLIDYE